MGVDPQLIENKVQSALGDNDNGTAFVVPGHCCETENWAAMSLRERMLDIARQRLLIILFDGGFVFAKPLVPSTKLVVCKRTNVEVGLTDLLHYALVMCQKRVLRLLRKC